MADAILHGIFGSPFVRIAQLGFEEKTAPYRLAKMPFYAMKGEEHLARQPFGRIPALEHDGFALYETQAITRYVDEAFDGPRLQPENIRDRARMNQLIGIHDWYAFPSIGAVIAAQRVMGKTFKISVNEDEIAAVTPQADLSMREVDRIMGDSPYLAGDSFSLADIFFMPMMAFYELTPEGKATLARHPRLASWWSRVAPRPSMAKTRAEYTQT
ncbi:MAG: glutathione S-transferase family protein [Parvibaculum sp.]|uniref:glutathione S-transferase family protein n=1 Tax=Parvibaculum sp. TaxID=2024848 RepID=UPI0025FE0B52|nr:glutathione S-transferase family protein [Parvibaculum sp.]MCE9648136.1 glutathione S-transferase family protein [Parvibaculum sp.]